MDGNATASVINEAPLVEAALRRGILPTLHPDESAPEHGGDVVAVELLNLGYLADPAALRGLSEADMNGALAAARVIVGADRTYMPVYPGFPEQVQNLSTLQLIIDQIVYYLSVAFDADGRELDRFATVDRSVTVVRPSLPVADLLVAAKPLRVVTAEDLRGVATELLGRAVALSPDDRTFAVHALTYTLDRRSEPVDTACLDELLSGAGNRENWQHLIESLAATSAVSTETLADRALRNAQGPDDLLRVVLSLYTTPMSEDRTRDHERVLRALSDKGYQAVRVHSIPKAIRRLLVRRLGEVTEGYRADSLSTHRQLWRRILRYVHPYDLVSTDAERRAVDIVHSNIEYRTFTSLVESAIDSGELEPAVDLLARRPGHLVARIVQLATLRGDRKYLHAAVAEHGAKARVTQLMAAYNGLAAVAAGRATVQRVTGRANFVREQRDDVPAAVATSLQGAVREALVRRLRDRGEGLVRSGQVIGVLDTASVSTINRDASSADRCLERGERFQVGEGKGILRLFVHWFNGPGRVDLDLGALLLDGEFGQVAAVDYSSYDGSRSFATYSGDITDAPEPQGGAEFIDVDLAAAVRAHPQARYVAMTVNSYTGQHLSKVNHIAGAMQRSDGVAGELFDPRTVTTAFRSSNESTLVSPMIVDLASGEAIWIDTSNGSREAGHSITAGGTLAEAIAAEIGVARLTYAQMADIAAEAFELDTDPAAPVDRQLVRSLVAL